MDFREREIDFQEADSRYGDLKRQLDAGGISDDEFDAQLQQLTVQDDEGRLWAKSRDTGEWHYRDGRAWTRATPPGYRPLRTPSVQGTPDPQSYLDQGEPGPSSQTTFPGSAATQDQESGKRRRDVLYGVILTAGILMAAGIMLWRFMPAAPDVPDEGGPVPGEASGPAPGYTLFEHDSEALSVELPEEWDETLIGDSEGEKGREAWSAFLGEGESAGPSFTAVNDLYSWRHGTVGHQGIYAVASKSLAQKYTDDELVTLGPNNYSSACQAGTPEDFDPPSYSGRILEWKNCGGDSNHSAITVAVAPKDRECVIVAQIGGYFKTQSDEEKRQHVLGTLNADCSKIG